MNNGEYVDIYTSEDDSYQVFFSDDEIHEEACAIVSKMLGKNQASEDYSGLSECLSITDDDFEGLIRLYENGHRDTFIEHVEARAEMFWKEQIIENLINKKSGW